MSGIGKWTTSAGLVACFVLAVSTSASAAGKERYTGLIVSGGTPTQLIMSIKGWTSEAEAKSLKATLESGGPEAAQKALEKLDLGYISLVGSLGWPINAARAYPMANGGQQVVLLTNRPIGFVEGMAQGASLNYPFGIISLEVDAKGEGRGSIIGRARITIDDKSVIHIDPYAGYSYEITRVRHES
jgi:hypothetical protein